MSPRLHLFVTQRDRDEAVDRIMAAILDAYQPAAILNAYQPRPVDREEPNGGHSLSPAAPPPPVRIAGPGGRAGRSESTQRPKLHGLLPFERLVLVWVTVVTVLIVAGNLLR
jgi:hypothetical protein